MSKSKSYQSWIDAGYDLFSREGFEGIQIERLARILDLNKSGFYHYFSDRHIFFEHLMQQHHELVDQLIIETKSIQAYDPEFLHLLIRFKATIMTHMQLVRNRHIPLFVKTLNEVNDKLDQVTLPLWASHIGLADRPSLALRYYEMVRDTFYARVSYETLNYEFMHGIAEEAKSVINEMLKGESLTNQSK